MDKPYNKISLSDNPLKIEKDLVEIQNTIIHYGELMINHIKILEQIKVKDHLKQSETDKKEFQNPFLKHLDKLKNV